MIIMKLKPGDHGPSVDLLFWRAFSDFGLAIRFVATDGFNRMVCGERDCYLGSDDDGKFHICIS